MDRPSRIAAQQAKQKNTALSQGALMPTTSSRCSTDSPQPQWTNNVSAASRFTRKAASSTITSRRSSQFKANRPKKSSNQPASRRVVRKVFDKDRCFTIGDVVSICDRDDSQLYYAQIKGLLVDEYCEKYASVIWLIPTVNAIDGHQFDARSFVRGVSDETLHSINTLQFVTRPDRWKTPHLYG